MNIIGLDTTTTSFSLGLIRDEEVLERFIMETEGYHSEHLLVYLSKMLEKQNMKKNDVDGYALSIGPGSLTGIRVGLAFLKGIGFATGKPVIPVETLYAIAYEFRKSEEYICPILVTKRNKVFSALYRFRSITAGREKREEGRGKRDERRERREDGRAKREEGKVKREETIVAQTCTNLEEFLDSLQNKKILFVGNGVEKYKNELVIGCNCEASFAGEGISHPDPVIIAEVGLRKIKEGDIASLDALEPVYL